MFSRSLLAAAAMALAAVLREIPRRRPRRPLRAARPGPRRRGPRLLLRSRSTSSARRPCFSVKAAADGPITVRLEPCGPAMARLVDPKGKPLAGYRDPYLDLDGRHARAGPAEPTTEADKDQPVGRSGDYLSRIDPVHYADLVSDAQGRITFPALIPGATYRVNDMTTRNDPGGRKTRRVFVAGAGEAIELGDIVIEKPEP